MQDVDKLYSNMHRYNIMAGATAAAITLILAVSIPTAYGLGADMISTERFGDVEITTGIMNIPEDITKPHGYKRYLILDDRTGLYRAGVGPERISLGTNAVPDIRIDLHELPDATRLGNITGAVPVYDRYGYTGAGIRIAVVDTGVDFSNPDISESLARDDKNHPIMLDADGQGIVITNATFAADIDENGIIRDYTGDLPEGIVSSAYVNDDGVFLDINRGGEGTEISVYNSLYPDIGFSPVFDGTMDNDMKIGDSSRDYIISKSGMYKLGVIYQGILSGPNTGIMLVPVLVTDSVEAGVYDTVTPDMSTSWMDYTRDVDTTEYDFDFTDEVSVRLGTGNEHMVYDSDDDGRPDYSAGTIGAYNVDVFGVFGNGSQIHDTLSAINGTVLPPISPDGNFIGIMNDLVGHGTASAATIVSAGLSSYDIYNDTSKYVIRGVAPGAKIIPIKSLWLGDSLYGWLWVAGMDHDGQRWKYGGTTRADIVSNSWGISTFPTISSAPGMDMLSLMYSALTVPGSLDPEYPGVLMVSSAGNAGHGYGTMGIPNVSPYGITVGAVTNNVYVNYDQFKDQPRFGDNATHYGDVVDFTSRGPGILGDPKPDIMGVGAFGFVPAAVTRDPELGQDPFSLFGGTSMAAPIVSGAAAVLMESHYNKSGQPNPFRIKNILMGTADTLYNDPLTQGAGSVNIESAVDFVEGSADSFIVYGISSYANVRDILQAPLSSINHTQLGLDRLVLPDRRYQQANWFAGHLAAGQKTSATFTIENPNDNPVSISIRPSAISQIRQDIFEGATVPRIVGETDNEDITAYEPNYVPLSGIKQYGTLDSYYTSYNDIPSDADLLILSLNFDWDNFMNQTDVEYADDLKIASLYLYDWIDGNEDRSISPDELTMVSRAGSWGTVQEMRISEPNQRFEGTPIVGVYPVPTVYSYWIGDTLQNATAIDYTLSARYYTQKTWNDIWLESRDIVVGPRDTADIVATISVPDRRDTGVYQGFMLFESEHHTATLPVSYVVKQPVEINTAVQIMGDDAGGILYVPSSTKGAFDMSNRYMAGDWRQFYFDVTDDQINTASVEISWKNPDTSLSAFVIDPRGRIVQTNVPAGVFAHLTGWPSLDWLGPSLFSQGGGFYPVKNKDDTATVLSIPINQTGTYVIMTHTTLYGGDQIEPLRIAARFAAIESDLSSGTFVDIINDKLAEIKLEAFSYNPQTGNVWDATDRQQAIRMYNELTSAAGLDPNRPIYVMSVTTHHEWVFDTQLQKAWDQMLDLTTTPMIGAWKSEDGRQFLDVSFAANYASDQSAIETARSYNQESVLKIEPDGQIEFLDV